MTRGHAICYVRYILLYIIRITTDEKSCFHVKSREPVGQKWSRTCVCVCMCVCVCVCVATGLPLPAVKSHTFFFNDCLSTKNAIPTFDLCSFLGTPQSCKNTVLIPFLRNQNWHGRFERCTVFVGITWRINYICRVFPGFPSTNFETYFVSVVWI